jgi:hypothetical protein
LALFSPGKKRNNNTASANISTGPIIQFCTNDSVSTLVFRNTSPNSSYFTLASGGYIITISPMAMGILVVPTDMLFQKAAICGNCQPENTPMAMARNIHKVR